MVVDECNCLQDMSILHQHHHYHYNLCDDNDVLIMNEHVLFLNTNGYLIILFNGEIKSIVLPPFHYLSLSLFISLSFFIVSYSYLLIQLFSVILLLKKRN